MFDDNAEIRAMILLALPFPPLPIRTRRVLDDESRLGGEVAGSTHDVLSQLIKKAQEEQQPPEVHAVRKKRQVAALQAFMQELLEAHEDPGFNPAALYQIYCKYSIRHIETYFDADKPPPPVNLLGMGAIERGDNVHLQMCDYMAGQARILGIQPDTAKNWHGVEYAHMVVEAKNRLVQQREGSE